MTTPEDGHAQQLGEPEGSATLGSVSSDLEAELLAAERDFENGDYIELTAEELERCIETGEWPKWPDGSSL